MLTGGASVVEKRHNVRGTRLHKVPCVSLAKRLYPFTDDAQDDLGL
jgi:hypothetical protein